MKTPKTRTKAFLHALGYTYKALAADIGVSVSQARRILSDNGNIYLDEFINICEVTGIKMAVLNGHKMLGTLRSEELA